MAVDILAWGLAGSAESNANSYTDQVISQLPKGFVYKGGVNYETNLPASGNTIGDCYTVKYKGTTGTEIWGAEFVWGTYETVDQWIKLGSDNEYTVTIM